MTSVKKRSYRSTVRREQAEDTRRRILDAAADLFERDGYPRTTIRAIARAAKVAPDTVYATFSSKPRILTALLDRRLTGKASVLEDPEVLAIRDEPDQARQIKRFARWLTRTGDRAWGVYEIMRTAAAADAEMASVFEEMQGHRMRNFGTIAEWIARTGPLRMDVARAGEILWGLASPELGMMFRRARGWSDHDYEIWLADALSRTLIP